MYLSGYLVLSAGVLVGVLGSNQYRIFYEQQEPAIPVRAIQATCTKTHDCTVFLYEKIPEVVSVASGKDQSNNKAKVVTIRSLP